MPIEVSVTPRAAQQIADLDRQQTKQLDTFIDDLAARGCAALTYRLSGPKPIDHMCVKHLRDNLRVVVAFESPEAALIVLVGRHDDRDPVFNVYTELYRLIGVEPEADAGRRKPPCCDETDGYPPALGAVVDDIVESANMLRRTRRQR